jgi:soluble lytic murein transglycosylase
MIKLVLASVALVAVAAPALAAQDDNTHWAPAQKYASQLGPNARTFYQGVFAAIDAGRWAEASAMLDSTPTGPLHIVARAEIYTGKGSPKVTGEAMVALAEQAPELPQSRKLVALASGRGITALPSLPSQQELRWLGTAPRRSKLNSVAPRVVALAGRINPLMKSDQPNEAEAVLDANAASLGSDDLADWQLRIAWSYYITGDDAGARRLAAKISESAGESAGKALWVSGLAAWRQRDYAAASQLFDAASRRLDDVELVAAAHFWGARADMAAGKPERVDIKLKAASRNPETFYGLLALSRLGLKVKPVEYGANGRVEKLPNVRAALALAEIGQLNRADELIRHQARIGNPSDHAELATVAGRMDLPGTQLWLAHNGPSGAVASVSARYPAPKNWSPSGGWRVDRSLVYAHALQESQFRTNVTSPAGAKGLMQVMPGTANMMARRNGETTGSLSNPSVNMEYGQRYIETLRDMGTTGAMLPKVIAAYNAGPLPVGEWNAKTRDSGDPLLYIESIPYWETRGYVATVLRNYWMYQQQAGEKTPSMSALSQGMWPKFPGMAGPQMVRLDRVSGVQSAD